MSIAPLSAPLPPEWYWQPEYLEQERAHIFQKNWIFAGFREDMANDNDYVSLTIGGMPIVVRNMKGQLVAFRNICSHRHSLIHPPGKGNAMFSCLFHGWTYDKNGVPIGIPDNQKSFGLSKEDKCKLALEPLQVDQCGRFVFVRAAKQGQSLKEWLGSFAAKLEHISKLFDKNYAYVDQQWACNWKLGLEITLEGYHLPVVHPASFSDHIGGIEKSIEETEPTVMKAVNVGADDYGHTEYAGPHSSNVSDLAASSMAHLSTVASRLQLPTSDQMKGYDHFLIYPNLMIGVNGGTNVCVERYEPVAPDQTRVECWLMTGTPKDQKLHEGIIWQTIMKQWSDWTVSVLAEDQFACEAAQKGVRFAQRNGLLGRAEDRVRHYQAALHEDMMQTEKAA